MIENQGALGGLDPYLCVSLHQTQEIVGPPTNPQPRGMPNHVRGQLKGSSKCSPTII